MTAVDKLELPVKWGWLLALAVAMIVCGLAGIVFAISFTLASVIVFGALAVVTGGFQLWHCLSAREIAWSGRALHFLVALAYILVGSLLLWDPVSGSISLTLVLAGFLLALGVLRIVYAWKCRRRGWRWSLPFVGGLVNLLLAGLIMYGFPGTAFWVIGLFVAIEFIVNGCLLFAVALAVRRINSEIQTAVAK